jgi:hypothetical protein
VMFCQSLSNTHLAIKLSVRGCFSYKKYFISVEVKEEIAYLYIFFISSSLTTKYQIHKAVHLVVICTL